MVKLFEQEKFRGFHGCLINRESFPYIMSEPNKLQKISPTKDLSFTVTEHVGNIRSACANTCTCHMHKA